MIAHLLARAIGDCIPDDLQCEVINGGIWIRTLENGLDQYPEMAGSGPIEMPSDQGDIPESFDDEIERILSDVQELVVRFTGSMWPAMELGGKSSWRLPAVVVQRDAAAIHGGYGPAGGEELEFEVFKISIS